MNAFTRYIITPVPKPRQTQADKWKQRPAVMRYRAFADEAPLKNKGTHGRQRLFCNDSCRHTYGNEHRV